MNFDRLGKQVRHGLRASERATAKLPAKIIPTKIRRLKKSRKLPMDMRIPPLKIKILLESNPLKSRI